MSTSQPVIVLVHGAWADASSWSSVLSELQDRGFTVYAPPNPLRGLPQDSAYVHQFLTQHAALQGQPVVLVAAKRAGARITDVDAGHLSLISEAPVVTRVILEAVEATGNS